jgi:hypothetical protein
MDIGIADGAYAWDGIQLCQRRYGPIFYGAIVQKLPCPRSDRS